MKREILASAFIVGLSWPLSPLSAQNYPAPSYADTLINNASAYNPVLLKDIKVDFTTSRDQRLFTAAMKNLQKRRFKKAAARFDKLLKRVSEDSTRHPTSFLYYLAGTSHYFAGNDVKALWLLQNACGEHTQLNLQQVMFSGRLIADITAR